MLFSCLQLAVLFYPLWVPSFGFLSSRPSICSFSPSRQTCAIDLYSLPGVAVCECVSLAPRAPYTHTVFRSVVPWFVKGLRSSLAVVMALHEPLAVVMALHEPLAMALHGSPASLSDELFARPRAESRVFFRTLLHVLRVAACGLVVPNTTRSLPLRVLRV